jgi:flagellar basal-body rod protein FlgG
VNLQVGLGVRPIAVTRVFTQGNVQETNILTDFAIEGDGFFMVQYKPDTESDNIGYTRDGSFKLGRVDDGLMLLTSEGYLVLDINQQAIIFPDDIDFSRVVVTPEGIFQFFTDDGEVGDLDAQLGIVRFMNPQGLEAIGGNLLIQTSASGEAMLEIEGDFVNFSRIRQGVIEMSNVSVADEMVNLITAQRAYDLNSKAIQASDEMLQTANNLRR